MERKKKRRLFGCVFVAAMLVVSALGILAWLGWAIHSARTKPGPAVEVLTFHANMPAGDIEKIITNRIERWCNQAAEIERVTSRSRAGVSTVRICFRNDISSARALTMIQELVRGTIPVLPSDTMPPVVLSRDPRRNRPLGAVTIDEPPADNANVNDELRLAVRYILSVAEGAIIPTVVFGEPDRTVSYHLEQRPAVPIYLAPGAKAKAVSENISKLVNDPLWRELPPKRKLCWIPFGMDGRADEGLLTIYLRGDSDTRRQETEKRVAAVERLVERTIPSEERTTILSEVGLIADVSAAYSANAGPMDATIHVQLSRQRTLSTAAYASKLRRLLQDETDLDNVAFRFASRDMPAPLNIRIERRSGGKQEELLRLARQVRRSAADIKGTVDVNIEYRFDVEIDHENLQRFLDVRANIEDRERRDVIADVRKMLKERNVPEGMRIKLIE